MYLSDEEYKIVKQALDDADEMQKKYEETLDYIEKYIKILEDVIIDNNLSEAVMERYNGQLNVVNKQAESNMAIEMKEFHRKGTFEASVVAINELMKR